MMKPEWQIERRLYEVWDALNDERKTDMKLFWKGICSESNYSFEDAIRIFCRNYSEKEAIVLETLYLGYIGGYEEMDESFFYVLQWIADYELLHGHSCFSPELQEKYGLDFSVEENVEVIFELLCPFSPVCDIVWILENRFNVDSKRIEYCLENMFMDIFSGREFTINQLLNNGALNEFFGLRIGYEMFLNCMTQIPIDKDMRIDFEAFKEDYAIDFKAQFIG